ncbi:MAG TPA: MFS transporter [Candidatus Paceibacterota bacterium]|nr:MFS transporter [Candidatus Paceibacterota bacterium]
MDAKRAVLFISILASFVSFLDASVTNVALPAIMRDLGGGLSLQEWTVDAYLITLGSLILIAGSLADVYGQRKILRYGLYGFAAASLLCAGALSGPFLIVSRALQGVAGALLVPSSLSLIIATFKGEEQGRAIGTWTAWTSISFLIGPLMGGFLVDELSWRYIFLINILPIALALYLLSTLRVAESRNTSRTIDIFGAISCGVGLFGIVFSLIEEPNFGWVNPIIYVPGVVGIFALAVLFANEKKRSDPMLPLSLFRVRNFAYGNLATVPIYASLSVSSFLIIIFLQQVAGFSALEAGLALIPATAILFLLSSRFGSLSNVYGPRLFMTLGPLIAAAGFAFMLNVDDPINYWTQFLPGILMFGLGLSMTVAPLTSAVLGSIDPANSGIGSAINNAVSRIAGLLAIALVGVVTGGTLNVDAFRRGVVLMAVLLILGGIISFLGIRNPAARA